MLYAVDLDKLPEALREIAYSQIPFAVSQTINAGMFHTLREMQSFMDSGTSGAIKGGALPFTKKGMRVKKATKSDPSANLRFETSGNYSREYMIPILRGGTRVARKRKLPEVDKDAFDDILTSKGNFKRNWLQNALEAADTKRRTKGKQGGFYTVKFKSGNSVLKQRKKDGSTVDLVWFNEKSRTQRQTFDGIEYAEKVFSKFWDEYFPKELEIITYNELFSRMKSPMRIRRL